MTKLEKVDALGDLAKKAINQAYDLAISSYFFGNRNDKHKQLTATIVRLHELAQEHD